MRFPRMLKPRVIIERPRKTNPDEGESRGQVLRKYGLKRGVSDVMRKMEIVEVMKWDTPSKKKN